LIPFIPAKQMVRRGHVTRTKGNKMIVALADRAVATDHGGERP